MSATHKITTGQWAGWTLRLAPSGAVEARGGSAARYEPAPLRLLAKHYGVGEGPWPWLREHGVRRPSPSGPSGTSGAEDTRRTVEVKLRLPPEIATRLRSYAERRGVTVSGAVGMLLDTERSSVMSTTQALAEERAARADREYDRMRERDDDELRTRAAKEEGQE